MEPPHTVYILRSDTHPARHYVGITNHLRKRVRNHNDGTTQHTAKHRPWQLLVAIHFPETDKAIAFERYLKTGSGRAFAKRHF